MRKILFAILMAAPLVARADPAKDPKVERMWKAKCASCHGNDGKGQTDQGKKMAMHDITTPAWQKSFTDEAIKKVIADGVNEFKEGHQKQMDAYSKTLKPEQLDQLTAYCRALAAK